MGKSSAKSSSKKQTKKPSSASRNASTSVEGSVVVGGVFLILGILGIIGYFPMQENGVFIQALRGLFFRFIGWGVYILPPAFIASAIFLFIKKRKAAKQAIAVFLIVLTFGGLLHLILCTEDFGGLDFKQVIVKLWQTGGECASGGILSGGLAVLLTKLITKTGACIAFGVLTVLFICLAVSFTFNSFRNTAKKAVEYHAEKSEIRSQAKAKKEEARRKEKEAEVERHRSEQEKLAALQEERRIAERDAKLSADYEKRMEKERARIEKIKNNGRVTKNNIDIAFGTAESGAGEPPPVAEPVKETVSAQPVTELPTCELFEEPAPQPVIEAPEEEDFPFEEIEDNESELFGENDEEFAEDEDFTETYDENLEEEPEPALPEREYREYQYPPVTLLEGSKPEESESAEVVKTIRETAMRIENAFEDFGITLNITDEKIGATIVRYEAQIGRGVKLSKLVSLQDDIALALGSTDVRIAALPGKVSTVSIEVPLAHRKTIYLRDIIDTPEFASSKSKLSFAIGKNVTGDIMVGRIDKLPHMLIAGTTGSGKSVFINTIILSILYKSTPDEVKFIMIDPKMVEFAIYNEMPHMLSQVVTEPKLAVGALNYAVVQMEKRYRMFKDRRVRDIDSYNEKIKIDPLVNESTGEKIDEDPLPRIVVIIDELADLMMTAAKEVETALCRLAQMGRAAGIHIVVATQSPRADVITGLIKANIPSRLSLKVSSSLESRIILDPGCGAEKLLGNGDMLYLPVGKAKPDRIQGAWVTDDEREGVVKYIIEHNGKSSDDMTAEFADCAMSEKEKEKAREEMPAEELFSEYDEKFSDAVEVALDNGQVSTSVLQRKLGLGYARAARITDQLEEAGIVGPPNGSKPRELLISRDRWNEMKYIQNTAPATPSPKHATVTVKPVPKKIVYTEPVPEEQLSFDDEPEDGEEPDLPEDDFINGEGECEADVIGFDEVPEEVSQPVPVNHIIELRPKTEEVPAEEPEAEEEADAPEEELIEDDTPSTPDFASFDDCFCDAVDYIIGQGCADSGKIMRTFKLTYQRTQNIMSQLDEAGFLGPYNGSKPREVCITKEEWDAIRPAPVPDASDDGADVPPDDYVN